MVSIIDTYIDTYRAATVLIDNPGNDAPIRAAKWVDELLAEGDIFPPLPDSTHKMQR